MAYTKSEKADIAKFEARFYRRANGRITKREAARLARKFLNCRYGHSDVLARREPGRFPEFWKDYKKSFRSDARRHIGFYFGWYGPNNGLWPGMRLMFAPSEHGGGWVIDPSYTG